LSSHLFRYPLKNFSLPPHPFSFEQANQTVSFVTAQLFALFNFKYHHKMKTKVLLVVLLFAASLAMTSCASSRSGCKSTAGLVGYGGGR
jgi:predicted small secreted protein